MSILTLSTGMHLLKLIKRKLIINYALQDKLKRMNGYPSQQRLRDRLEHRCRKKDFLLMRELINR